MAGRAGLRLIAASVVVFGASLALFTVAIFAGTPEPTGTAVPTEEATPGEPAESPSASAGTETATPSPTATGTVRVMPTAGPGERTMGGIVRQGPAPTPTSTPTPIWTPTSTATLTPTPSPTPPIPSRVQWPPSLMRQEMRSGDIYQPVVYLSFDDGWGYAQEVLNVLNSYGVKATACFNGSYMQIATQVVYNWYASGMAMCNHTWSHLSLVELPALDGEMTREEELAYVDQLYATYEDPPDLSGMSDEALGATISSEVGATENIYRQITGNADTTKPYLRPPYGATDQRVRDVAANLGYRTILWSVDPQDWRAGLDPYYVAQHVLNNVHWGAIVLLHTGRYSTVQALPMIIEGLHARGYTLETFHRLPDFR